MLQAILETLQTLSLTQMSDKLSDKEKYYFDMVKHYLAEHDFLTNQDFQELAQLSAPTARRYLNKFAELGLVKKIGQNRNRRYQLQ